MSQLTQQARAAAALAAAAGQLATAERAARNINRMRGNHPQPPSNPINLGELINTLVHVHEITGGLGKTVRHYAQAVRWPHAGYSGAFGEHQSYPGAVIDTASRAEYELDALAAKLLLPAVAFSSNAIADLEIALARWRINRRNGASG
jgi:hypothetical protein